MIDRFNLIHIYVCKQNKNFNVQCIYLLCCTYDNKILESDLANLSRVYVLALFIRKYSSGHGTDLNMITVISINGHLGADMAWCLENWLTTSP